MFQLVATLLVALAACGTIPQEPAALPRPTTSPTTVQATPPPRASEPTPTVASTLRPSVTVTPSETPSPVPQPWRFVVLGDTRTAGLKPPQVTYDIVAQARNANPEVVLTVGDMIKAMGDRESVREQWRNWRAAVTPLGARHILPTPGNHDVEGNRWATDLFVEAFPELPENGPPDLKRLTYSFDFKDVRFISLNSEIFGDPHHLGDEQLAWLEEQLRSNTNRYTIVFSHDPAYPVGPHIGSSLDAYPADRDRLWDLLAQYRVTAYIAGHEHLYNHRKVNDVEHIIAGTSGSSIYAGYGGEFYHYLVGEVWPDRIIITTYDQQGQEQDRIELAGRF